MNGARLARTPIPLALAAGVLLAACCFLHPGAARIVGLHAGAALAGLAAGLFLVEKQWTDPGAPILSRSREVLLVLLAAVGIAVLICRWGMCQFGGFDLGIVIDAGWRVFNGQRAHIDFPATVPPAFYLGAGYAYRLFGVSWRSLVRADALFAAATFLWSCWLLRNLFPNFLYCLLLAAFVQAAATIVAGFWWYNNITTVMGVVFFLSAVFLLRCPDRRGAWLSYFVSLVLMAAMKAHVAGILILGVSTVLFTSREHRWKVVALSALAFLVFAALLAANHITVPALLKGYLGVAEHGANRRQFFDDLLHLSRGDPDEMLSRRYRAAEKVFATVMAALILVPLALRRPWRNDCRQAALGLLAIAAGLEAFYTNGELKIGDLPLILLGAAVCFSAARSTIPSAPPEPSGRLKFTSESYLTVLATFLLFIALAEGATRLRVLAIGFGRFFEYETPSRPSDPPFFDGMPASRRFDSILAETRGVLLRHPGATIFFGPRLQWGYAAFGLPSPVGQPIWWHPGVSFAFKDEETYVRRWAADKFDVLIFLGDDRTYFPDSWLKDIAAGYAPEKGHAELQVFLRNK